MTASTSTAEAPAGLLQQARALLIRTMTFYRDDPRTASWLRERLERIEAPLRIAVTGRVKSGKSTLINALVGAELAPTDAEERTQVNTVYQYGPEPRITAYTPHGAAQNVPVTTLDPGTIRDLQRWRPDEISRLVIDSPSPGLQAITLIETPGVSSSAVKETGRSALAQILSEADAMLYLTRHPHQTDIQFLQSAHELEVARRAPINTILAFSRADEVGSGGSDAMPSADRVAELYRNEPRVRSFAQYVLPVIGLLGQAAATLDADDFDALAALARLSSAEFENLLLSADRFVNSTTPETVSTTTRQDLLQRFGRFGVEHAVTLITRGAGDLKKLRSALLADSRLNDLQESLHQQFVERQEALRARSVLMAVEMVLRANPRSGGRQLRGEFERLLANAHEWDELRLLSALRSGQVRLPPHEREAAERLLGAFGNQRHIRLGRRPDAPESELSNRASDALLQWRTLAMDPMRDHVHREAARTVLRSCERLIADTSVRDTAG
ncbi:dynamin family protein [Halopolyspora algeriensis]|uniref:Dynamin family protein n=1 Tax=Halopolyspora algeriensis TaxID=1500506 RepID=A0A368VHZ3_9ACTN|nr:dynamin family protein [Halopolyspora algeriensis]RCW40262.1 dynamin family protein [Halopolyspora algeriensis]TQM46257.1 dynamin family protein [Halopolyspora algeriensis]